MIGTLLDRLCFVLNPVQHAHPSHFPGIRWASSCPGVIAVMTFQIVTAGMTAMVTKDGDVHPDLMDEMSRRCVRLFVEANASLPDEAEPDAD